VPEPTTIDARAVWLNASTITVPAHRATSSREPSRSQWTLHWSPSCTMTPDSLDVDDHVAVPLKRRPELAREELALHPELTGHIALRLPEPMVRSVPEMLTGQLWVERARDGQRVELTGIQLGRVLDSLHADSARKTELGAVVNGKDVDVRVWAPTAQRVVLLLWRTDAGSEPPSDQAVRHPMARRHDGVWEAHLQREHVGWRYLFEVAVYAPSTGRLETNLVTDPYSAGLTLNSARSVIVDLADPCGMPEGFAGSTGPQLDQLVDATIYELHVRDFSANDPEVPERLRGSYLAFTADGQGARHLASLAQAGMNTVHLLPCFDITSINEDRTTWVAPQGLADLDPASHEQQRLVAQTRDRDAFNWGYDPWHWMVPEGSYASSNENADGIARVREFRAMVAGLHRLGLRVVMDQVFTHTAHGGQDPKAVLDRIVPGYYHRLDQDGRPYNSTVCNNTAPERAMGEKMMVDACVRWARDYRVDGFRFDLMGHSSAANMSAVRDALDALTVADDGVDGREVYLYGEGWNFGEVADNALFFQATQGQLASSGVATFSDRLRDAVRGGRPMDDDPRRQGFGSGLYFEPNGRRHRREQAEELAEMTDLVQLGLAGNLRDYEFTGTGGKVLRGDEVSYFTMPAGYADEPSDVVSYVDAHDNETLWDSLTMKLPPSTSMASRIRMNTLSLACATLSQTPVLWHAGADLLRSKSLDRNSFDSGDWFNHLDWSGADNGFGRGLPPAADNRIRWRWLEPLLREPSLKPTQDEVELAAAMAHDLLRLRFSTPLFRLGQARLVHEMVRFPVSGTEHAQDGVIVMHVDDSGAEPVDAELAGLVLVLNARPDAVAQAIPGLQGRMLELSRVQAGGSDEVVKTSVWDAKAAVLHVPGRTAAVFCEPC